MTDATSRRLIILTLAVAAFVGVTSQSLPPIVASHFDGNGHANGFMTRTFYTWFMVAFVVVIPAMLAYLPATTLRRPGVKINLPHADYWLAPSRREETLNFLKNRAAGFGAALAVFLGYVHWLVLRANRLSPPQIDSPLLIAGLVAFVLAMLLWIGSMLRHFYRVPPDHS